MCGSGSFCPLHRGLELVHAPVRTAPIDLENLLSAIEDQDVALATSGRVLETTIREAEGGVRHDGLILYAVKVELLVLVRVSVYFAPAKVKAL